MTDSEKALTVQDVAEMFRVSPATIYRRAQTGELPSFRMGRTLRFWENEVREAVKQADPWRRTNQARARRGSRRAA